MTRASKPETIAAEAPEPDLASVPDRLIAAAKRLIRQGGVESVTVKALIAESDVYPDAVRYHFGGKAALIAAVVESLANDESLELIADTSAGRSGPEQIHRLVSSDHELLDDPESFRDFYAILPHVVVDDDLRDRVAQVYLRYRQSYAAALSAHSGVGSERLDAVTAILLATIDGLAVQRLLDPGSIDLSATLDLLEEMLGHALESA